MNVSQLCLLNIYYIRTYKMNDVTTPAATVIQGPSLTYFCLCTVASRIHVTEMNKGEEKEIEIERDQ